jgi:hypothetical protein
MLYIYTSGTTGLPKVLFKLIKPQNKKLILNIFLVIEDSSNFILATLEI